MVVSKVVGGVVVGRDGRWGLNKLMYVWSKLLVNGCHIGSF